MTCLAQGQMRKDVYILRANLKVDSFDVFGSRTDEERMQLLHRAVTLASKAVASFHALAIGGSAMFAFGRFI